MPTVFSVDGDAIDGTLTRPSSGPLGGPAVVIVHGFPSAGAGGPASARGDTNLADRIAETLGWNALTFSFRGCGASEGNFSIGAWRDDLTAAVEYLDAEEDVGGVYLAGFGTGGALAICTTAALPSVRGVAALAPPADFDDWAHHPRRLLQHARELGLIRDPAFPASLDAFGRPLRDLRAVDCAAGVAPRPMLLIHGSEDELVPTFDARVIADAYPPTELRIINGAGHQLRSDPRAVALLLGWLDRQRHASAA